MIVIMSRSLCELFEGARLIKLDSGGTLFRAEAQVRDMFMVKEGRVLLQRHTVKGTRLILHEASRGTILAEASVFSSRYHCDAVATESSLVASLPKPYFRDIIARDPTMAEAWMRILALSVQAARLKSEIRSLPKVSDRLDAWLDAGNCLPKRGRLQDVAAELGVTREALYRELAKRRK